MIEIRHEQNEDISGIRAVNEQAFNQLEEAGIVDKLRQNCHSILSLVAKVDNKLVGHILFSPATIEGAHGVIQGMGLAPMGLLP
jgi:putative acetyltransferase